MRSTAVLAAVLTACSAAQANIVSTVVFPSPLPALAINLAPCNHAGASQRANISNITFTPTETSKNTYYFKLNITGTFNETFTDYGSIAAELVEKYGPQGLGHTSKTPLENGEPRVRGSGPLEPNRYKFYPPQAGPFYFETQDYISLLTTISGGTLTISMAGSLGELFCFMQTFPTINNSPAASPAASAVASASASVPASPAASLLPSPAASASSVIAVSPFTQPSIEASSAATPSASPAVSPQAIVSPSPSGLPRSHSSKTVASACFMSVAALLALII